MSNSVRVLQFLKPHYLFFVLSLLFALAFAGVNALFLPLIQDIFNELGNKNLEHFNNHIFNAILLYSLRLIFQYSQLLLTQKLSLAISMDIQFFLYRRLLSFSQHFYAAHKLGEVFTRLFDDSHKVKETIIRVFSEVIPQLVTFVVIVILMFIKSFWLTVFSLIAVPIFVVIVGWAGERLKKIANKVQNANADVSQLAYEAMGNIKLVQAYCMEQREFRQFKVALIGACRQMFNSFRLSASVEHFIGFLQFLVIISILWFGGYQITEGELSGPELAAFFTGIFLLIDVVIALSRVYAQFQQGVVSIDRIYEFIDMPPRIVDPEQPVGFEGVRGAVDFTDVSFTYPDAPQPALDTIQLQVRAGETVALVGGSGAGKSTLVSLLPRFFDPDEGKVTIDGVDIRDVRLTELRQKMAMVLQEDVLFRGSIFDNVSYGLVKVNEEQVIEALKQAQAWDFVKAKPDGLRTLVTERGANFSGGQRQRLSIARAILRDPKILILDEATSSLDAESEDLVQQALVKLMENRTTFVIAHRLATIQHADRIIVLDKGKCVEDGTHAELLAKGGTYARLYQLQFSGNG